MKSENMDADSKGKSDFSQENNTFTEDCDTEQEEHQQRMITTAGIPTTNPRKRKIPQTGVSEQGTDKTIGF